jgi:hypothetical protein
VKTIALEQGTDEEEAQAKTFVAEAIKEIDSLHEENKRMNKHIRRLDAVIERRLKELRKNLGYAQGSR